MRGSSDCASSRSDTLLVPSESLFVSFRKLQIPVTSMDAIHGSVCVGAALVDARHTC